MKQLLLAYLLVAGLAPAVRAQSTNPAMWCPPGATWTYRWVNLGAEGTLTVRYARDTLVANQPVHLLTQQLVSHSTLNPTAPPSTARLSNVLTRTVGDRVEVWATSQFYTLYNFAAQPGLSWLTPRVMPSSLCASDLVLVTVDSVGTQALAGRSLRWLRVHLTSPTGGVVSGQWPGRIYEQLGSQYYLQPQPSACWLSDPGYTGPLRTFQATGWPIITATAAGPLVLATAPARAAAAGFGLSPNPTAGVVHLLLSAPVGANASLELLDFTGRVIWQGPLPATGQLDLRALPVGAYTLRLVAPGQAPVAQWLLRE